MHISYNAKYHIAYIKLRDHDEQVLCECISEDIVVDKNGDGEILGIELLDSPTSLWEDLQIHNQETGQVIRISQWGDEEGPR